MDIAMWLAAHVVTFAIAAVAWIFGMVAISLLLNPNAPSSS
jgi:hypothetical protein